MANGSRSKWNFTKALSLWVQPSLETPQDSADGNRWSNSSGINRRDGARNLSDIAGTGLSVVRLIWTIPSVVTTNENAFHNGFLACRFIVWGTQCWRDHKSFREDHSVFLPSGDAG